MKNEQRLRYFMNLKKIYEKITFFMIILSVILLILGYMFVQAITSAPVPIIYASLSVFYYHIAHFIIGLCLVMYYMIKVKKHFKNINIKKTILSIIFTPVSLIVAYIAVLLLSLSSCVE
jgi:membrane protease YdiL (CAAX protease family)